MTVSQPLVDTAFELPQAVCVLSIAIRSSWVVSRQNQPTTLNRWHRHRPG